MQNAHSEERGYEPGTRASGVPWRGGCSEALRKGHLRVRRVLKGKPDLRCTLERRVQNAGEVSVQKARLGQSPPVGRHWRCRPGYAVSLHCVCGVPRLALARGKDGPDCRGFTDRCSKGTQNLQVWMCGSTTCIALPHCGSAISTYICPSIDGQMCKAAKCQRAGDDTNMAATARPCAGHRVATWQCCSVPCSEPNNQWNHEVMQVTSCKHGRMEGWKDGITEVWSLGCMLVRR